ncbi:DUF1559 domain-containing protein [Allorhodopirellula heiligendammensis]|uniref:DUF1559 domain-containing protein n=1 Tax=Allorhodopirellula heiligendammensis TaxID=2714739 RepID=A0A5C6BYM8_9BACT|nr:DUF1559 domain-containing protein [Allorhodopirellula heiligendammensis]TWU16942.1 hypothetical protein Poly21_41510 [Allorhodopirellula heiligendammensis]
MNLGPKTPLHLLVRTARLRAAFTLVELLVVIAIIGVLVGLLLPAVQSAREAARRMQCSNSMRQVSLAMHNYHDTYQKFPTSQTSEVAVWSVSILPQLEAASVADLYDDALDWDEGVNLDLATQMPTVYQCASNPSAGGTLSGNGFQTTDYSVLRNATDWDKYESLFQRNKFRSMRDIIDGTSSTCMIYESAGRSDWYVQHRQNPLSTGYTHTWGTDKPAWSSSGNAGWMFSCAVDMSPSGGEMTAVYWSAGNRVLNVSNWFGAPYSFHTGGIQMGMADGSVRFIGESIAFDTLKAMTSINGGEVVGEF